MQEIRVDPEFRDKIPAMPTEDFEGLRADIIRDGYVRDPLVVWDEENILLDGHHRWRVIQEHPKIHYTVDRKSFPDRWAAIAWICANQLHKHNMTPIQKEKLIQEEHDARQKSEGAQVGNKNAEKQLGQKGQVELHPTRQAIAEEHNISEKAVRTAVEVGRGIDRAAEVDSDFKREILSGEVRTNKAKLAEIRKMESDDDVKAAIEEIRNPQPKHKKETKLSDSDYAANRQLFADIRKTSAEMASSESTKYTQSDLVSELRVIRDEFIDKVKQTLKIRKSVIGNGEMVLEILASCERKIIEIEEQIGGNS